MALKPSCDVVVPGPVADVFATKYGGARAGRLT
jgi:hypothetical protein